MLVDAVGGLGLNVDGAGEGLLRSAAERMSLSARATARVLKVARTVADLAGEERVGPDALAEAIGYRSEPLAGPSA